MGSIEKLKKHSGACNSIKIRAVCQHCNNGWMSRLDKAVKPILTDLMLMQPQLLDQEKQRLIAGWIAMKIMVIEYGSDEPPVATPTQRHHVMTTQSSPDEWKIWLAAHTSPKWTSGMVSNASTIGLAENGAVPPKSEWDRLRYIVIGVGKLLAVALYGEKRLIDLQFPSDYTPTMRQIQPFATDVRWVPLGLLDEGLIDGLVVPAFDKFTARLTWMPDEPQAKC